MRYNMIFDYAAFAVLAVLLAYYFRKRKATIREYRQYHAMLVVSILLCVTDILVYYYYRNPIAEERILEYIVHILDLAFQFYLLTGYCNYMAIVLTGKKYSELKTRLAVYTPMGLAYLAVLLGGIFAFGDGLEAIDFRQGEAVIYSFVALIVYTLFYTAYLTIKYGRSMEDKSKLIHMVFTVIVLVLIQCLQMVDQQKRIMPFLMALLMTDMLYTVHRSNEFFDSTDSMHKHVMMNQVAESCEAGIPYFYVFVKLHDYKVLTESIGQDNTDFFLRQVSGYLESLSNDCVVFRAAPDIMALRSSMMEKEVQADLIDDIRERFREPWRNGMLVTMLSASFVTAITPEEVPSAKVMRQLVNNISRDDQEIDTISAADKYIRDDKDAQMLEAIRRGLRDGNFKVFYQPIYSTKKKKIVAAEALIRLFDPEYGSIPAEPMIALAEREGYILQIGRFVFEEVCRFYKDNKLGDMGVEYIEVNLSAVQCMQKSLAEEFMQIMHDNQIAPDSINFEITESAAMITNAAVTKNIYDFELHGVSLSLDDYGTGYSNISYLYDMPFMIMKIDKSILWSAETNKKADITLENTYKMANKLHLKVVQEGVETEEQIKKLLDLGCDYFQGYYFSKPVEGETFIEYVKNFEVPGVCNS